MKSNSTNKFHDSEELSQILKLTMKLSGYGEISCRRSKSAVAYWDRVIKMLKMNQSSIGYNAVYAALYCTHWGTYPTDLPNNRDLRLLVDLLRSKFETTSSDMKWAKEKQLFSSSLTAVLKSNSPYQAKSKKWHSKYYARFLELKTRVKLYGGEYTVEHINLLETSLQDFADMQERARARAEYETVKGTLIKLIPVATGWSDDAFSNDHAILTYMRQAYGVDYAKEWKDFDALLYALEAMRNGQNEHYLLAVDNMPLSVARVIWPVDTEKNIERIFCEFCTLFKNYVDFFEAHGDEPEDLHKGRDEFMASWLYRQIMTWYKDKTYQLSGETRSWLLSVSMGDFK